MHNKEVTVYLMKQFLHNLEEMCLSTHNITQAFGSRKQTNKL